MGDRIVTWIITRWVCFTPGGEDADDFWCVGQSFAPRCYTCKTAIIDERVITLDDPALGKRTYHEQHFFCAECGDPFLAPSISETEPGADAAPNADSGRTGELNVTG